jgi:hypothetical protein
MSEFVSIVVVRQHPSLIDLCLGLIKAVPLSWPISNIIWAYSIQSNLLLLLLLLVVVVAGSIAAADNNVFYFAFV